MMHTIVAATSLALAGAAAADLGSPPLTSTAGQRSVISGWSLKSSSLVAADLARVAQPGVDVSSWPRVAASKCTVMACLMAAGEFDDADLWFSDNLTRVDASRFTVPWVYRSEFALAPGPGRFFTLETHGITSRADIFLNGHGVAQHQDQAGSYGGHAYDITPWVRAVNALVVNAHPADFGRDLVQGFVDWNPAAPDNGSGVWRDMYVKQTGPVSMGPLSVAVDVRPPVESGPATVTVRALARNLESRAVRVRAESTVMGPSGASQISSRRGRVLELGPRESRIVEVTHVIAEPQIWWPRQWGDQPLYKTQLVLAVDAAVSDTGCQTFGVRSVTSAVNEHNDTIFTVNGHDFQVLGAGYAADHFFRWDRERFRAMARYSLDMGLNTLRLEGMMEHPELYDLADEMGLMIMAGWPCCSKWEAWRHNHELALSPVPYWDRGDYRTAAASMAHEAAMLQPHPSLLAFLVGSDSWPDDEATRVYADALAAAHWQVPVVASAAKRGYPALLGPSGMKMDGPYDWVPPGYWFDTEPAAERRGAAFGFGSELGAGVGTPELASLERFLSRDDLADLWERPDKDLFHMSARGSAFRNRSIYNRGLFRRYGAPTSLADYVRKAQMMDYEATRAQHEAYASRWRAARPATRSVYWMLNGAWPGLHWALFDHGLHPAGAYFGVKAACRAEHAVYDPGDGGVWLVRRSLGAARRRSVAAELVDLDGGVLWRGRFRVGAAAANSAARVGTVAGRGRIRDVGLLRLTVHDDDDDDARGVALSRSVHWLPRTGDRLDWNGSTWYHTPVARHADLTALGRMAAAAVAVRLRCGDAADAAEARLHVELENRSPTPALFVRVNLAGPAGDVAPVLWSDNYVTLWPRETLALEARFATAGAADRVAVSGANVEPRDVRLGHCR